MSIDFSVDWFHIGDENRKGLAFLHHFDTLFRITITTFWQYNTFKPRFLTTIPKHNSFVTDKQQTARFTCFT